MIAIVTTDFPELTTSLCGRYRLCEHRAYGLPFYIAEICGSRVMLANVGDTKVASAVNLSKLLSCHRPSAVIAAGNLAVPYNHDSYTAYACALSVCRLEIDCRKVPQCHFRHSLSSESKEKPELELRLRSSPRCRYSLTQRTCMPPAAYCIAAPWNDDPARVPLMSNEKSIA